MNSRGNNGDKISYRIILLLAVGLTAFSSAMNELNQVQQLTLDVSRVFAQWSSQLAPVEVPQQALKVKSCERRKVLEHSTPSVELPWLGSVAEEQTLEIADNEPPASLKPSRSSKVEVATVRKGRRLDFDPVQFEVRIPTDQFPELPAPIAAELPVSMLKAKPRRHNMIRINTRDREMLLKTLNGSINLRISS